MHPASPQTHHSFEQFRALTPLFVLAMSALLVVEHSSAATIVGVTINSVSSEGSTRAAVNVVNGSGLSTITGAHVNQPDVSGGTMWMSNGTSDPLPTFITFDLGSTYDLNSLRVWNYNENYNAEGVPSGTHPGTHTRSGARSVDISVADSLAGNFTSLGNFTFNEASGSAVADFSQIIDLSGYSAASTARLVRFDILSNWSTGEGSPTQWTGLSEVQFDAGAAPEPSRTMFCLLGIVGLILRRRRS